MAKVRFGPARVPSRRSPKEAISMLERRGFTACEIDFEGGFWMDYPWATRFGELAREAKIVLSVHAPIAGFMGHLDDFGSLDDVVSIAGRCGWIRPVLDFAHMHATSDGAFIDTEPFVAALAAADAVLEPKAPFHIHFSDIAFANRNETKHLPYGEGTLRADPLRKALR